MVQVIVREQHGHFARLCLGQLRRDRSHPGARVEDQSFAARADEQQGGRVAAEFIEAGPEGGLASPHSADE